MDFILYEEFDVYVPALQRNLMEALCKSDGAPLLEPLGSTGAGLSTSSSFDYESAVQAGVRHPRAG